MRKRKRSDHLLDNIKKMGKIQNILIDNLKNISIEFIKKNGKKKKIFLSIFIVIFLFIFILNQMFIVCYVPTRSMEPTIKHHTVVFCKEAKEYKVGDIAIYKSANGKKIIHRIVDENYGEYTFKGDNNEVEDIMTVEQDQIVGKLVFQSHFLGILYSTFIKLILFIFIFIFFDYVRDFLLKKIKDEKMEEDLRRTEKGYKEGK